MEAKGRSPASMPDSVSQPQGLGAIDHVEFYVPDREVAAKWYGEALGFEIVEAMRGWAIPEGGPLMISADGGTTKLALFAGEPLGQRLPQGFRRLAMRASAAA